MRHELQLRSSSSECAALNVVPEVRIRHILFNNPSYFTSFLTSANIIHKYDSFFTLKKKLKT